MGLLGSLFGGGTKLELQLDTAVIPEGGTLSGTILVSGGKKPLQIDALKVRLVYVLVTPSKEGGLPKIDLKVLLDNTVVSNQALPPALVQKHTFSFAVPKGTDPSGTYKVVAVADIPGVKDPSAESELKVIPPYVGKGGSGGILGKIMGNKHTEEQVLGQFPDLLSADEDELRSALFALQCEAYDRENNFTNIDKFLANKMMSGSPEIRETALAAWAVVMDNRVKPENIKTLESLANDQHISRRMLNEVIAAAARFAEEGALPLVQRLTQHPDPEVRAEMATRLRLDADEKLVEKKQLLIQLAKDPDQEVRAAAFGGLNGFASDPQIANWLVSSSFSDPSAAVQSACVSALSLIHHHGMMDLLQTTYMQHTQNRFSEVREELTNSLMWIGDDPRTANIIGALLKDPSVEVRRKMSWQGTNMSDHPEFGSMFMQSLNDSDEEVRANTVGNSPLFMPLQDAIALAKQRFSAEPTKHMAWACLNVARRGKEQGNLGYMQELTQMPNRDVAQCAREELET
jgi:uncharacterized tellurite resistance protein B-like protein